MSSNKMADDNSSSRKSGEDISSSRKESDDNPFISLLSMKVNSEANIFITYKEAADAGDAKAQYNVALCYERGNGVERDYAKARMYYAMASMQGHTFATHNLGVLYYFGYGGEQDFERAFSYFCSAAITGDPLALASLSVCYEMGRGVEKDTEKAEDLMKKAISQSNKSETQLDFLAQTMRVVEIKEPEDIPQESSKETEERYYFNDGRCSFKLSKKDILNDNAEKDGLKHTLETNSMMITIVEIRPGMPSFPDWVKTKNLTVSGYPCLAAKLNPLVDVYNQYYINCKEFVVQVTMTKINMDFLYSFRLEK